MNIRLAIAPVLLAAALASGCATLSPVSTPELTQQVTLTKQTPFVSTWRSPQLQAPIHFELAPVQWSPAAGKSATSADQQELATALEAKLRHRLGTALRTGPRRDGDLVLRATITGVNASSPAANAALSLLVGPLDTGGASVQFELVDPATNQPLGVLVAAKNGKVISTKGFKRWGHAEWAFDAAAVALAEFVQAPTDRVESRDAR